MARPRLVSAQANILGLLILLSLEDDWPDVVGGLIPTADGLAPVGVFEVVRFTELGNSGGSTISTTTGFLVGTPPEWTV